MLSKKVFWQWFQKEVQSRWKSHHFEWNEAGDWYWRLQDFDIETLTQAVRQHKTCECYPIPNLKKVHNYAKTIQSHVKPRTDQAKSSGVPETHTFIMCTEKDERGKGPLSWFVDILICPLNKTYSYETYQRVATQQAARHKQTYGGVWEVFTQTNQLEMLNRRMKLLNIKPLDLKELRCRYRIKARLDDSKLLSNQGMSQK